MNLSIKSPLQHSRYVFTLMALFSTFTVSAAENTLIIEAFDHNIQVEVIADGLELPWAMAMLANGDILVTEQPGRLRLISEGQLQSQPITGTPEITGRLHSGLMDVALHPEFETNHLIYLTHSKITDQGSTVAVTRGRLEGTVMLDSEEIFQASAWEPRELNYGSRAAFDGEGYLYITIGDRGPDGEPKAQDLGSHHGKTVRLHDDGSIPTDNPFVNTPGALPDIWTYGHRNQQGLMFNEATGEMWASEHGPRGGDEVNILKAGANYGWPIVSFGRAYTDDLITNNPMMEGIEPPRWFWVPSIGISDIIHYSGDAFPEWKNKMFVTAMSGMMLQSVVLEGRASRARENLITGLRYQYRDIDVDAQGNIYALVRQDANSTENSGKLLKLEPAN
jgi:aldose sugar dehydrogenase